MTKKSERLAIFKYIEDHTEFDAATVTISKDGKITALKDPNKINLDIAKRFTRYLVGYADEISKREKSVAP